ncbi:MAG TPA: helix-turn-helix transcriptional regulator [Pseudonocardia sp.]
MTDATHDGAPLSVSTPSAARRRLGLRLKAARDAAGVRLEVAAAAIQRSGPTLSRLENGRAIPRVVDVKALLEFYVSRNPAAVRPSAADEFVMLAERAREPEWFTSYGDVLGGQMTSDDSKRYVEFENDALGIRTYEPATIPGLLQTKAYAAALTELVFPDAEADDRARFVEFRLARQHVLNRSSEPLQFDAIIGEATIRRAIGGPSVMEEQLRSLLAEIDDGHDNVTVRIAPLTLSVRAAFGGPFVLMDLPDGEGLLYLEVPGVSQYRQGKEDIDQFVQLFRELSDAVADRAASRKIIEGVLEALR